MTWFRFILFALCIYYAVHRLWPLGWPLVSSQFKNIKRALICFELCLHFKDFAAVFCLFLQNVILKMKLRPVIQSDAESVATGSCTRRGQRDVSLWECLFIHMNWILNPCISLTLWFQWLFLMLDEEEERGGFECYCSVLFCLVWLCK